METISELIDKLSIVNIKLYHLVDLVENPSSDDKAVAKAARTIQKANRQRSMLKNEINAYFGNKDQEVKM